MVSERRLPRFLRQQSTGALLMLFFGVAIQSIGAPSDAMVSRLFFGTLFVGAGIIAIGERRHAATVVAVLFLITSIALRVIPGTISEPPSNFWTQELSGNTETILHTIMPPYDDRRWVRGWETGGMPMIYVCARGRLETPETLDVAINGTPLTSLDPTQMFGPRPQPQSVGFYRIPMSREQFGTPGRIEVTIRRHAGASRPIEVCGTITAHPTAGKESSQYFDGVVWASPWSTRQGRFQVELRLEGADGHVYGAWY